MDILSVTNALQPNTIKKFALNATDFPNGESSIAFMGGFVQLFDGATLPDPATVSAYEATYSTLLSKHMANKAVIQQIDALEAQQTPRRMREALSDPTWLNALNTQIVALRAQLTT